jgi:hypothetical protein
MNRSLPSRRWFLAGGAAVLLGGGAGAAADLLSRSGPAPRPRAPEALLSAVAAERTLLADLDATTGGSTDARRAITAVRADHAAHLAALTDLLTGYRAEPRNSTGSLRPRGTPRTLAELRAAEQRAATSAGGWAAALSGGQAALLASIAACEAGHAVLMQ